MQDLPLPKFRLSVLSRFALAGPDGPVDLPNKKLAGLLAYLACTAPVPQSREKLETLFWGSHFQAQARQNLRQALFRLRRVLGQEVLISDSEDVRLAPGTIDCDAARLEVLVREGSRISLSLAADLYQDQLLSDVNIGEEAWLDWLGAERTRLERLALDAMLGHATQLLQAGEAEAALKAASRAIAVDALREDGHRLVVQALASAGRKPEALKHYQKLVALLRRELNTEPDALTRTLIANIDTIAVRRARTEAVAAATESAAAASQGRAIGLERRQVTIVVCRIVDSLSLSARLDPEDMHDLMLAFHSAIAGTAARLGGFVAQYDGDGARLYFGYPQAHEHDSDQAVRAALAILAAAAALKAPSGEALAASLGIATGLVVVSEQRGPGDIRQHVAVGEASTLAAQLQATAGPGEILMAASTRQLVGRAFDCRPRDGDETRWLVRGETTGIGRFAARRTFGLSPLVGRQEDVDLLRRRWDSVRHGAGQVVFLSGEPGIGKSRIADHFLKSLASAAADHVCFRLFCSPHHAHSPLHPFLALIERSLAPNSSAAEKLDVLHDLFRQTAGNAAQDVALIAEILGLPLDGRTPAPAVSSQQKRELTLNALIDWLAGTAARHSVAIVLEDVHWIDPTSLDLLNRTVGRIANLPVLLVVTSRPEFEPGWAAEPHVSIRPLSRLGRADSLALIGGVVGGKALPDQVREQILARTDGVPLFIEEFTRALLESDLLRESGEDYVLDGSFAAPTLPTTLRASLVSRLDRVGSARDVALIGAAIGREFSHELIAAVAPLPDLDSALKQLTAAGIVSCRGAPPVAVYAFRHVLMQDAAYGSLLKRRRQRLHADIAHALIERFPATVERTPEVIAHHLTEAGLAQEAIGHWRKAGQLASEHSAGREAVKFFELALHLLSTQSESQSTMELRCDLRLELRLALLEAGAGSEPMVSCLREAEALAERLDDDHRRAQVFAAKTSTHALRGELDAAQANGARALELADRLGDLKTRIVATSLLVQVHHARGEYARVVELAPGNLAALPTEWVQETLGLGRPPSVLDRGWLVMSLAQLGRFGEAVKPAAEAIRLAAASKHPLTIGWAHFAAGALPMRKGDWAQALEQYEHVIAVCRASKSYHLIPLALAPIPLALAQLGQSSKAQERLRECTEFVERQAAKGGSLGVFGPLFAWMGRAALRLEQIEDAQRLGSRAVESCRHHPGYAVDALQLQGEIATHRDCFDAESAERYFNEALAVATSSGMRPFAAHCHFGLGKVFARAGKHVEAQHELTTATAMYRGMDMPFWLAQVEAELPRVQ